jgi:flotillin
MENLIGYLIAAAVVVIMAIVVFIKTNLEICAPNEVMIFSGRRHKTPDGQVVGYRVVRGGRALRMPFVESVSRLSLNAMPIELDVSGALTRGVIPLDLKAMANVKVAGSSGQGLDNAIERFLGKSPATIATTAREIVEGAIRGVVATMSPEEANASRLQLAQRVSEDAGQDLQRMGLILDTLKIQELSDEKGYLEALARKKNAEVQRDARIVEARSDAEAAQQEAEAKRQAEIAAIDSQRSVTEADLAFKVQQAEWASDANRAEERAGLAGDIARMEEQRALEEQRVEANRLKFTAEVVVPAEAEKQALQNRAAGQAAATFEEGRAKAEALELLRQQWQQKDSRELFLIQLLPEIVDKVATVMSENLHVERLTVVDNGNGGGVPQLVGNVAGSVNAFMEQVKTLTGVDLARIAEKRNGVQD